VLLALRYLGETGRRGGARRGPTEEEARGQMGQLAATFGQQAKPLPDNLKELIRAAEQLKQTHRGL
jgi:hypothetical protein